MHTDPRWLRYPREARTLELTMLYRWYAGDFAQAAGSPLRFAARWVPALEADLEAGREPSVEWLDYDWRLNSIANAQ